MREVTQSDRELRTENRQPTTENRELRTENWQLATENCFQSFNPFPPRICGMHFSTRANRVSDFFG